MFHHIFKYNSSYSENTKIQSLKIIFFVKWKDTHMKFGKQ